MNLQIKHIKSQDNKYLKTYRKLNQKKWRKKLGLFPLEGFKLVQEALQNQIELEYVIISRELEQHDASLSIFAEIETNQGSKVPVIFVDNTVFNKTAFTDNPQGIIAAVKFREYDLDDILNLGKDILLTADIQDPGNAGTLMRSAVAFELGGVIFTGESVDPTNEKVIRSSMGAIFRLMWCKNETLYVRNLLNRIFKAGYMIIAAMPDEGINSFELNSHINASPLCIVVGNETVGIPKEIFDCDIEILQVNIPISSKSDSLNAAVAGSIIMYQAYRTRLYKDV